jgi:hypothetical protein
MVLFLCCLPSYLLEQILSHLRSSLPLGTKVHYAPIPTKTEPVQQSVSRAVDGQLSHPHRKGQPEGDVLPKDCTVLFLGGESLAFTNLLITHGFSDVSRYDYFSSSGSQMRRLFRCIATIPTRKVLG